MRKGRSLEALMDKAFENAEATLTIEGADHEGMSR